VLDLCDVSTVFLGLDYGFMPGGNAPVLFESMVFWRGEGGNECRRSCTWAGAEMTHRYLVAEVCRPRAVWSYIGRMVRERWDEARQDWRRRWRELREGETNGPPGGDPWGVLAGLDLRPLEQLMEGYEDFRWGA
jgi:hypothetical protein